MRASCLLFLLAIVFQSKAQTTAYRSWPAYTSALHQERMATDSSFRDSTRSPLDKGKIAGFTALDYFDADSTFVLEALYQRHQKRPKFEMATSTERKPVYRRYGQLTFTIKGQEYVLQVYQNVQLVKQKKYRNHLFLPFTDVTSGNESYGGGRYLDLEINPKLKEGKVILDFNRAYNPYCAYGHRWSCPIPPRENDLNVKVEAGVKAYAEH